MKNIVITGASSGIGEASARILAAKGHQLCLVARNTAKLEKLRAELGERIVICPADVKEYDEILKVNSFLKSHWKQVDVLVNNAGLGYFDKVADGKIEEWHNMFDTNVKGLLNCLHVFLPDLIASHGQVINVGSVASHHVFVNTGVYCATKHAVFAISEALRLELPDKIRVTTISPGSVNTPFIDVTTNPKMLEEYKDYFAGGLSPEAVAAQIGHAIEAPENSVISEIVIRPARKVK